MAKGQVPLSYLTFTLLLEEMMSGPVTAKGLADHSGITHKNVCRLLKTMHRKRVVHVAGWEKDTIGRMAVRVYALGAGRDAAKPVKPRAKVNREYRARAEGAFLAGTPFAGLMN